jgi:hypothetical protein
MELGWFSFHRMFKISVLSMMERLENRLNRKEFFRQAGLKNSKGVARGSIIGFAGVLPKGCTCSVAATSGEKFSKHPEKFGMEWLKVLPHLNQQTILPRAVHPLLTSAFLPMWSAHAPRSPDDPRVVRATLIGEPDIFWGWPTCINNFMLLLLNLP